MRKIFYMFLMVFALCFGLVGSAFAALEVTGVANLAPVEAWLGIAVVAYLALFGYRKFVKSANRS